MIRDSQTRAAARVEGRPRYVTGLPCKHGHLSERYTSTGGCIACDEAKNRRLHPPRKAAMPLIEKRLLQRARQKAYRLNTPARPRPLEAPGVAAARAKAWRAANPDRAKGSASDWGPRRREKARAESAARSAKRRAREANAEGHFTAADVAALLERQEGQCAACPCDLAAYHVDHRMPLALGGSNWPFNLQLLCPRCNLSKGAKHPDEWLNR